MENNYVPGKKASEILGVHQRTLYNWEEKGIIDTIRTPGGKRLYNVQKFLSNRKITNVNDNKQTHVTNKKKFKEDEINDDEEDLCIIYARVSSMGQKDDLERQIQVLKKKYPKYKLIKDIGSGINFNRRGLRRIIKLAISGKIKRLVVVHKDRLARFGYELIEDLIKEYSSGEIIIMDKKCDMEPEEELVKDVLTIMNVFVARMNGLRKYKKLNDH